ncbi:hemicentin-1-like [Ixodes scapularis]|uniref:hemicentin-1-like n=1 Tax=Ixodes scapularis TaxID=6945 RepID=UPI001C38D7EE|nr:hemicentin-1-like [Ixodes scapularis]
MAAPVQRRGKTLNRDISAHAHKHAVVEIDITCMRFKLTFQRFIEPPQLLNMAAKIADSLREVIHFKLLRHLYVLLLFFCNPTDVYGAGRPDIMPFSFSANSALGQKSTVSCVVSFGQGPFDFYWTQEGKEIEDSPRKHTKTVTENVAVMTIEKVTAEDLGNYTCTVSNAAGSSSHSATLVIEGPPEVQPFSFSKNIALGQKAVVNCGATNGDGPFKFRWVHDGKNLHSTSSIYVKTLSETVATLVIEKVGAEDVGNYTMLHYYFIKYA